MGFKIRDLIFQCTIPGRAYVKKNTAKVYAHGAVYSKKFRAWEKGAKKYLRLISLKHQMIDYPVHVVYRFYFENRSGECDVSNVIEGPQDLLEKCRILKNDKLIHSLEAAKFFGKENGEPRTEIEIYKSV